MTDQIPEPSFKSNQEVVNFLISIFGDDVIVDNDYAVQSLKLYHPETIHAGAWWTYYTGDLYYQSSLLKPHKAAVAAKLRSYIRYSEGFEQKAAGLPPLNEVLNDHLWIRTQLLEKYIKAGVKVSFTGNVAGIMQEAARHEKAWMAIKEKTVSRLNELLLESRVPSENALSFRFGVDGYYGNTEYLQLCLLLSDPIGIEKRLVEGVDGRKRDFRYAAQDIFNARAKELGIDHLFQYETFHRGTHAAIDEERLILNTESIEELWLKIDEMAQPEKTAVVQQFFKEVIREVQASGMLTHMWRPKTYWDELEGRVPRAARETYKDDAKITAWIAERERVATELGALPQHVAWDKIAKPFFETQMTVGDVIKTLHNPPDRDQTVFAEVKRGILETFPLFAEDFPQRPAAKEEIKSGATGELAAK